MLVTSTYFYICLGSCAPCALHFIPHSELISVSLIGTREIATISGRSNACKSRGEVVQTEHHLSFESDIAGRRLACSYIERPRKRRRIQQRKQQLVLATIVAGIEWRYDHILLQKFRNKRDTMPLIRNSKVYIALHVALIVVAAILSAVNGFGSILTVLVFSGQESARLWVSIYLPAALWIVAIICFWFPKSGFAAYTIILASSILLAANPLHSVNPFASLYLCSWNLRFAIWGGAPLLVNLFVPGTVVDNTRKDPLKYIKVAGIVWGLVYFSLGAINTFLLDDNATWTSVVLAFTLFLLPISSAVVALRRPKAAGGLLLGCVAINVVALSAKTISWYVYYHSFSGIFQYLGFIALYNIPHIFFGIVFTRRNMNKS